MAAKHDLAFANVIKYLRYNTPLWLLQKPNRLWVLSSCCGVCLAPWVALSELVTSVLRLDEARTLPEF